MEQSYAIWKGINYANKDNTYVILKRIKQYHSRIAPDKSKVFFTANS